MSRHARMPVRATRLGAMPRARTGTAPGPFDPVQTLAMRRCCPDRWASGLMGLSVAMLAVGQWGFASALAGTAPMGPQGMASVALACAGVGAVWIAARGPAAWPISIWQWSGIAPRQAVWIGPDLPIRPGCRAGMLRLDHRETSRREG